MISIFETDNDEERTCKEMFNQHYFGAFRGASNDIKECYMLFRTYAQTVGSYISKKYNLEYYSYRYIKIHFPEFLSF
jgi:hypothetical protein